MNPLVAAITRIYRRVIEQPVAVVAVTITLCLVAAYHARSFTFDASADTLVVEGDPALAYYRHMTRVFDDPSFLLMTYTPNNGSLFAPVHLEALAALQAELGAIEGVSSTMSLLDAPLLQSPPIPLEAMADDYRTLGAGTADPLLAQEELLASPLWRELLVSRDGRSAAILVRLTGDPAFDDVLTRRDALRMKSSLTAAEMLDLERLEAAYVPLNETWKAERSRQVASVRRVRDGSDVDATLYLSGVPMVADDMISYVRADTVRFGSAIVVLVGISLWFFFRRLRWVVMPLATTAVSVLLTIGVLGYLNQAATVISSSFVSLIAIITISFTVHLIVRYRELRVAETGSEHVALVVETMQSKFAPCAYTALTTMVAFGSLVTSGIQPVSDFGWMMCLGIVLALLVTSIFFPGALLLLRLGEASPTIGRQLALTEIFCRLTTRSPVAVLVVAGVVLVCSLVGMSLLSLDNRFVDYFKEGTEVREGMVFIDRELGGTLPLEVVIDVAPFEVTPEETWDDDEDPFAMDSPRVIDTWPEKYWFTPDKIELAGRLHDFMAARPDLGVVLSLASLERAARDLNDGEPLDALTVLAVLELMPVDLRESLVLPYGSPEAGELRISTRLRETWPSLSRDRLIEDIQAFAASELALAPGDLHVTGAAVLFNNMLKQMFASQASTIGFVLLATVAMFTLLLRSWVLGLIGVAPNVIAPLAVLGIMGAAGIPLDLMTITIAAIVIGIGVDDAIHYLHRFREERAAGYSAVEAVERSHASIGSAMYFTSLTIMFGFSVLALSNFVPTVYFGLLTALAMALALVCNLTVLPALLLVVYGRPRRGEAPVAS